MNSTIHEIKICLRENSKAVKTVHDNVYQKILIITQ